MRKKKRQQSKKKSDEAYPNLTYKELDRDVTNLYMQAEGYQEADIIMDSAEERVAYLKKNYSKETLESLGII